MSAELRPLCTAVLDLGEARTIATGEHGTRLVAEIVGARFEGERFNASLLGTAAADWASVDPDGRIRVDVRMTLQTDDGATVLVTYQGRGHVTEPFTYAAPVFDTGDERYEWLTRVQAVGKSEVAGTQVHYEMFQVV